MLNAFGFGFGSGSVHITFHFTDPKSFISFRSIINVDCKKMNAPQRETDRDKKREKQCRADEHRYASAYKCQTVDVVVDMIAYFVSLSFDSI